MRFIILTEGGETFGLGHVSRCTSIYDALKIKGIDAHMVVAGDTSVESLLGGRSYELFAWHGNIPGFIARYPISDGIILDSIAITQGEVSDLETHFQNLTAIDDYRRYKYSNSTVVDWTVNVEKTGKHDHNKDVNTLLLGCDYAVLREPFWKMRLPPSGDEENILITMGGADIRDLTVPVVQNIKKKYPQVKIHIVLGPAFKNKQAVVEIASSNVSVFHNPDSFQMYELIASASFVVSAGGQTLYELSALRIPCIAIEVIENQREDINGWLRMGLVYKSFVWDEEDMIKNLIISVGELLDQGTRNRFIDDIKGEALGSGVFRILEEII